MRTLLPPHIQKISPYLPGKPVEEVEREFGLAKSIKLASNENPLGPSPKAVEAARKAAERAHRYPDGGGFYLRQAISRHINVPMERVILGAGSTDLIEIIARTFLDRDDNAVISENAFIMYRLTVQAVNGNGRFVPMKEHTHDLDAMAAAVDGKTKIVYIANPNNPSGTYVTQAVQDAFLSRVPDDVVVVLDEAYCDYIVEGDYPKNTLAWVEKKPRLIVLRTFSKAHGLAGLRIGYGVSSPGTIEALNRIRSPFNANSMAQAAAVAALEDDGHILRSRENNLAGRDYFYREFRRLGVEFVPTAANFVLAFCPCPAEEVFKALLPKGLIVRPMGNWGYPKGVRVSIGRPEENEAFVREFEAFLKKR